MFLKTKNKKQFYSYQTCFPIFFGLNKKTTLEKQLPNKLLTSIGEQ